MNPTELATLARHDREAARQVLDGMTPEAAAQVLAQLPSRDVWQLIFLARNPTGVVRALPKGTFFTLFHEVGPADAVELLPLATPGQVGFCLDLECWQRGELAVERVDEWLHRLREAGPRTLFRHLAQLDFELLVVMFAGRVRVSKRNEDVDPVEMDDPSVTTLDDLYYYWFEEDVDPSVAQELSEAIKVLRNRGPELTADLMEALRQELPAALTEEARQLRDGRLADEGLPDFDRALGVLARLDPHRFDPARHRKLGPGTVGDASAGTELVPVMSSDASYLIAALAGLAPDTRSAVEHELAYLTNEVLVAMVRDFADLMEIRRQASQAVAFLGLGLEHLSRGDIREGTELLRTVRLEAIFRVGRTLVLNLVARIERLRRDTPLAAFGGKATILGHVVAQTMDAVGTPTPLYPRSLDVEGEAGFRTFESLADVSRVDAVLTRGEAVAVFVFHRALPNPADWQAIDLSGCTVERLSELSAHQLVATMIANAVLDLPVAFQPIPIDQLVALRERLRDAEPSAPGARLSVPAFERWLEPRLSGLPLAVTGVVQKLIDECTAALGAQLGSIPEGAELEPLAMPTIVIRAPELLARAESDLSSSS